MFISASTQTFKYVFGMFHCDIGMLNTIQWLFTTPTSLCKAEATVKHFKNAHLIYITDSPRRPTIQHDDNDDEDDEDH